MPFTAGDGFECNLINVRGEQEPTKGPVILVHGAGVRANIFRAPVQKTFVEYLVEHGYARTVPSTARSRKKIAYSSRHR